MKIIEFDAQTKVLKVTDDDGIAKYPFSRDEVGTAARECFIEKTFPKLDSKTAEKAERVLEKYIDEHGDIDELIDEYADQIATKLYEEVQSTL